uniref:Mitochondrial chaperone BCS1 n=1 Tax=Syphacia muris TaxID=451379 RepID=A0A158R4L2_9BILA
MTLEIGDEFTGVPVEEPAINKFEKKADYSKPKNFLSNVITGNPYFNAGAGLTGIGLALALLRRSLSATLTLLKRRFVISLEMDSSNVAYPWLLDYINKKSSHQTLRLSAQPQVFQTESGRIKCTFNYFPSHGIHYFVCNNRWIQVDRQRQNQIFNSGNLSTPFETVTLTTLGSDVNFFKKLLENASAEAVKEMNTGLIMYNAVGPEWRRFGKPLRKRAISSVVLEEGLSEKIQMDFEEFCKSSEWYAKRGIPYRRGYLFYGPPGTGKSSYITALASHYGFSICTLSLSERTLDDERLKHLLNTSPSNSVVLLEDIDVAFSAPDFLQKSKAYDGLTRVTFSGLLNAIDGVGCSEERILFMTTNHIEVLDSALIRPGRVDLQCHFGLCSAGMIYKQMFNNFYGARLNNELLMRFRRNVQLLDSQISPAQLQGHLLLHKTNPESALQELDSLKQ